MTDETTVESDENPTDDTEVESKTVALEDYEKISKGNAKLAKENRDFKKQLKALQDQMTSSQQAAAEESGDLETLKKSYAEELAKRDSAYSELESQYKGLALADKVKAQAAEMGIISPDMFWSHAQKDFDLEDGKPIVKDKPFLAPEDYLKEFCSKNPWAVRNTGKSGNGVSNPGEGSSEGVKTKEQLATMGEAARKDYYRKNPEALKQALELKT